jgi:hypothetical protein
MISNHFVPFFRDQGRPSSQVAYSANLDSSVHKTKKCQLSPNSSSANLAYSKLVQRHNIDGEPPSQCNTSKGKDGWDQFEVRQACIHPSFFFSRNRPPAAIQLFYQLKITLSNPHLHIAKPKAT